MSIPFLDLKAQYASIKEEIDAAITSCVENTAFIKGDRLRDFETAFAEAHGVKHAIGCSSGTTAAHAALIAAGVGVGDEVVLPSMTFIATAECVVHAGAKPVLVDCLPDTLLVDPAKIEDAITDETKAIMPVHLYGQLCDMKAINEIAARHDLVVIEDAAQAHLAEEGGTFAGGFGDYGAYSLYPGKNLGAYGDGGMVVTNDDEKGKFLRMIVDHGRTTKYEHQFIGYNYRLDSLQAAICSVKLKHLPAWTEARQRHAERYDALLADVDGVTPVERQRGHVYHLYVIRTDRRDELQKHLKAQGVSSGIHYPIPLHEQPALAHLGTDPASVAVSSREAKRILSLPIFPEMTEAQQDEVVTAVKSFFDR